MRFEKYITTMIEFTTHITHFYAPINLWIYTLYVFADKVFKQTPLNDKWNRTKDLKTCSLTSKGIWFLTRNSEQMAAAIFLKLHLDVLQKSILSQRVFLDNNNSQQILLNFR